MENLKQEEGAVEYYKERYGIDITEFGDILRLSLENLFLKGVRLSPDKLFTKLSQCGVQVRPGTVDRTRLLALVKRVPAEPAGLTHHGARFWYESQLRPFDTEEIMFLSQRFPKETAKRYPSLWKGYLMDFNTRNLPDYVETELLDSDECVFQQRGERSEG
jgi:hypothetical protein